MEDVKKYAEEKATNLSAHAREDSGFRLTRNLVKEFILVIGEEKYAPIHALKGETENLCVNVRKGSN